MPPHLHPRSRATSTLFAGTLLASFAVVAVPHIWPCPRPRKQYLDSEIIIMEDGRAMRRVRKSKKPLSDSELSIEIPSPSPSSPAHALQSTQMTNQQRKMQKEAELLQQLQAEAAARDQENARRPCPVPKPRGALGRFLGFEQDATEAAKQESR